jgi:tripartite-type tricarboxylate transporter receptor subunit TctC
MEVARRQLLGLMSATAAFPFVPHGAEGAAYPSQPVQVIVPFAGGSAADVFARLIGQRLSERLGKPFVVENRLGAGGNAATETVVRATPDGHTILIIGFFNAINASLYSKLNFDFLSDIIPAAGITRTPNVMEVAPSFPATTVPEFIAYAREHSGKISMASAGIGTSQHVFGELFMMMTGIEMLHVPYRSGSQALTDLIGGQVQVMFDTLPQSMEHIKAGELRALAVTTATRSAELPEVPTIGEFVQGYEASGWQGVGVPARTPVEIVRTLNSEINACLAQPDILERLAKSGATPLVMSPADFSDFVKQETTKWAKVVKFAGAQAD